MAKVEEYDEFSSSVDRITLLARLYSKPKGDPEECIDDEQRKTPSPEQDKEARQREKRKRLKERLLKWRPKEENKGETCPVLPNRNLNQTTIGFKQKEPQREAVDDGNELGRSVKTRPKTEQGKLSLWSKMRDLKLEEKVSMGIYDLPLNIPKSFKTPKIYQIALEVRRKKVQ
ncbi:DgyrCDS4123 [Dimorphilus gyrociliatus]|uniref:DgyrCDS4123 n=1 Tax=Dimorphilus gyrociliatus TaxID=2664684 RepID=A0A7I8VFH5_9ANNE|nr:DgyrCDS4123 [Dimorphilus gyrociliatus]